ncbi:MAG TPA: trypsin-like peptidase domain-containing protein [Terriglobia bacterium]|nr:trypsin-like peptidase domain-containing protein [Terriglobia bacterium]
MGTAFIMGRPIPNVPDRGKYVLITAAHVLAEMAGDVAILHLRHKLAGDRWISAPLDIHIRANGRPLWTKHPSADVAVMYVNLPTDIGLPLLPTTLLADDAMLSRYEIHPGDELECLGYPLGASSNAAGFPILRSGRIASYPLLPTAAFRTFLFDFRVFKGNSGGPVYFVQSNRTYGGHVHIGQTVGFIAGLVSGEKLYSQRISSLYQEEVRDVQLNLAVVVDASLIRQAIDMLPNP